MLNIKIEEKNRKLEQQEIRREYKQSVKDIRIHYKYYLEHVDKKVNKIQKGIRTNQDINRKIPIEMGKVVKDYNDSVIMIARKTGEALTKLNSKFESMEEILEEKNSEINSYREGFEYSLNNRTYMQLIRLKSDIERNQGKLEDKEIIKLFLIQMMNILNDIGIEELCPEKGEQVDTSTMAVKNVEITEDSNFNNRVNDVLSPGYFIKVTADQKRILKDCEVSIYKMKGK